MILVDSLAENIGKVSASSIEFRRVKRSCDKDWVGELALNVEEWLIKGVRGRLSSGKEDEGVEIP